MARKTKANVQYTVNSASDVPVEGELMYFDGSDWLPVNSKTRPIPVIEATEIRLSSKIALKAVGNDLGVYSIGAGGSQTLRAKIIMLNGDIEGFST